MGNENDGRKKCKFMFDWWWCRNVKQYSRNCWVGALFSAGILAVLCVCIFVETYFKSSCFAFVCTMISCIGFIFSYVWYKIVCDFNFCNSLKRLNKFCKSVCDEESDCVKALDKMENRLSIRDYKCVCGKWQKMLPLVSTVIFFLSAVVHFCLCVFVQNFPQCSSCMPAVHVIGVTAVLAIVICSCKDD